jgi:6-phosphogluconolactonase
MARQLCVFVGTYTQPIKFGTGQILEGKGEGIYCYELDLKTGALILINISTGIANPSYLALDESKRFLYAVNELKEFEGKVSGAVSAFSIEPARKLTLLNQKATLGTDPCYVIVNNKSKHVFVTNFASGSISVFPKKADGSLGEHSQFIQHEGSSRDPRRQQGPHAHSLTFDKDNGYAFIPDLGIDKLMIYKFDQVNGRLETGSIPFLASEPGAGPRYCAFHPAGKFCYLINELNSTLSALSYDKATGSFEVVQTVPTIIDGSDVENTCADVHISPDGKYVYASNRGHDSIIIYGINQTSGKLTYAAAEPCGGKTPRNFAIDPTGTYLLVGNQDTDNIVVFARNLSDGTLKKVSETQVGTPVCIKPCFID